MNTKTKTIIITALLLLAMVSGAVAQEKWEYGSVQLYNCVGHYLISTSTGENYSEKEVDKNEFQGKRALANIKPLLQEVNEMAKGGWEVYDVGNLDIGGGGCLVIIYSIKRKTKT